MASNHDLPDEFEEMVRFGTVESVDHDKGRIVVRSGDIETDDIRWLETRNGKTRTWSPPSEGEQVVLLCPSGEIGGAVALRGMPQDKFPLPGNSTRELIQFDDGAVIAYDPEAHHMDVTLPGGATLAIEAQGGVTIKGDVTVEGDVIADGISLKQHLHTGVQAGPSMTGAPQP